MSKKPIKTRAPAFILLESLITLALLAAVTSFTVSAVTEAQRARQASDKRIEQLNVAKMALDKCADQLTANGVTVEITRTAHEIRVSSDGKEILDVQTQ